MSETMERRARPRVEGSVRAYLSLPGQKRQRCTASDVSSHGAFVEMPQDASRQGAPVQIVFALNRGRVTRLYARSAIIVRVTDSGAGLMFSHHSSSRRFFKRRGVAT